MTFRIKDQQVGMQAIDEWSTTQRHPLGTRVKAIDDIYGEGEFIYLKGQLSIIVGTWVTFNADDSSTALLAANAIGPVAVAMSASGAGRYGWYQVYGKAVGRALAAYADNGLVYATAIAGSVDDVAVVGDRVKNALGASAVGTPFAGVAEFKIQYPFMDDGTAA